MMTRDLSNRYRQGCADAPPPLNVYNPCAEHAAWWPLARDQIMFPQPPGPQLVTIPGLPADELGEDPTDPTRQHGRRYATAGMIDRLNVRARGAGSVTPGGGRR